MRVSFGPLSHCLSIAQLFVAIPVDIISVSRGLARRNLRDVVGLAVVGRDHKPARNSAKLTPRDAVGQVVHGTVMKQEFSTYRGWLLDGTD